MLVRLHEDWLSSAVSGNTGFLEVSSGNNAGASIAPVLDSYSVGVVELATGTTTTGRCSLTTGTTLSGVVGANFTLGGGVTTLTFRMNIPVLSTSSQEYVLRMGFGDRTISGDNNDGVYFEYNRTLDTHWLIKTSSSGSRTAIPTSVTVMANVWVVFKIESNFNASRIDYYIDGVNVGNIQSNIPTATASAISTHYKIEKTSGRTDTAVLIDYSIFEWDSTI